MINHISINWLPYLLLSPFYLFVGSFVYWFVISLTPAVTYRMLDYTRILAAGDELTITTDANFRRSCNFSARRYLVQDNKTTLISTVTNFHSPGEKTYSVKSIIPTTVSEGDYDLVVRIVPDCNWFDDFFPSEITIGPVPLTIDNTVSVLKKISLDKEVYHVGEKLTMTTLFDRRRNCNVTAYRQIINEKNEIMYTTDRQANVSGLGNNLTISEVLYPTLSPGKYTLKASLVAACPEGMYQVKGNPVDFKIIP